MTLKLWLFLIILLGTGVSASAKESPSVLKVSENGRFLLKEGGKPFFYMGDTAWELFHRLDRDEAIQYLDNRAEKGFTVIQAVALAELDGLRKPNAFGHLPFINADPTRPDVKEGPENDYWDHVDFVVESANSRGLVVGLLPTWGDKWNKKWGIGPEIFTPENAEAYGKWLGQRYRENSIIWILGGDRPIEDENHRQIIHRMAKGLREGDDGRHLMTFHTWGGHSSADYFADADWLDFNMRQNGHMAKFTGRYDQTRHDYDRQPTKPIIDGEPIYEGHPISFKPTENGYSIGADVRRPLYWNLFSGAFGHTYGHHSVWQMWSPDKEPVNGPLMPWYEAVDQSGATQMQFARKLLESRPFLTRIPDDSLIVDDPIPASVPGAGRYRFVATRDKPMTYAMVYVPVGRRFRVRLDAFSHPKVIGWWFNPRNGEATRIGSLDNTGEYEFTPPDEGEVLDWILVLDDASKSYPPPGASMQK